MTGELFRGLMKHKIFGTVVAVERDERGVVLLSAEINGAIACVHRLAEYELTLEGVAEINQHIRDYESFEPVCSEPAHLLADIGAASKECQVAEQEFAIAHSHAKALKERWEQKLALLRHIVQRSTAPLPLFDKAAGSGAAAGGS